MKAPQFLEAGIKHMQSRAKRYDKPQGERSMAKTTGMMTILHGEEISKTGVITEEQGWDFMELLKIVRSSQGEFHPDNYEDRTAYAGLAGEAAHKARASKAAAKPAPKKRRSR